MQVVEDPDQIRKKFSVSENDLQGFRHLKRVRYPGVQSVHAGPYRYWLCAPFSPVESWPVPNPPDPGQNGSLTVGTGSVIWIYKNQNSVGNSVSTQSGNNGFDKARERKELLANLLAQAAHTVVYPASLAQKRLWFLDQLQGRNAAYNVHLGFWLDGPLDLGALRKSLQEIIDRHDSLQTSFRLDGGELQQIVTCGLALELPIEDVVETTTTYADTYRAAQKEVETPFDLSRAPLFRTRLLRVSPQEHVLLCTMHHIVTDAWSVQILARELPVLYEAFSNRRPSPLPDLPINYGDYSEWQYESLESEQIQQQISYWKQQLRDAPPILQLPTDRPRPPEQTYSGASQYVQLPPEIMTAFKELAPQWRATPFMMLLAAFKILLYRYSGQPDVLVGVPVAGRSRVETEPLVGFFVNTLAMRDDLSGNPRFSELLEQVRETSLGAFANGDVPFEKIVEVLQPERNLSYNPIFQVMFAVIKGAVQSHGFGNLTAFPYIVSATTSIFDLTVTVIEGVDGKWFAQIEYNTDLFGSERIASMLEDYTALLQSIRADPETRVLEFRVRHANARLDGAPLSPSRRKTDLRVIRPARASAPFTPEQERLLEIWKKVLGIRDLSVHDNFFDVGGHSLMAARLTAEIHEVTGRKLPVAAIFRAPTVAKLARILKENPATQPEPMVAKLNAANHDLPFFGIAVPAVDTSGFAQLARHMTSVPFYRLQAPAPILWERHYEPHEIRALAADYVATLRSAHPHGPYCLAAMCLSVLIAQEMVIQLEAVGEEVGLFVIFDTWVLENTQVPILAAIDYYLRRLAKFEQLAWTEKAATVRRCLRRWFSIGNNGTHEITATTGDAWKDSFPGDDFQPPQFRAPVLLFKRPRQPYYRIRDPQMGWGARSLGGIQICEIDCGHAEMLREPYVGLVVQAISNRVQQIHTSKETSSQVASSKGLPDGTSGTRLGPIAS